MKPNTSKKSNVYLWPEKWRPKTVDDVLLPKKYKRFFKSIIKKGELPNLLLHSSTPGSGKTTIAKALCNDMDMDYLYINISSDSGIDTLRSQIQNFASTLSFDGKPKAVIMDEFDGATPQLQNGMRAFIEEFHKSCRFIFTCNYLNKIIKPLQEGRVMAFDFDMSDEEISKEMIPLVIKRVVDILKVEEVDYEFKVVRKLVEQNYPNNRKVLALLQKYSGMNGVIDENIFKTQAVDKELYDLILNKKITEARQYILDKSYNYDDLYVKMFHEFIPLMDKGLRAQAILEIGEYMHRHSFTIDPEINFTCLLVELMSL